MNIEISNKYKNLIFAAAPNGLIDTLDVWIGANGAIKNFKVQLNGTVVFSENAGGASYEAWGLGFQFRKTVHINSLDFSDAYLYFNRRGVCDFELMQPADGFNLTIPTINNTNLIYNYVMNADGTGVVQNAVTFVNLGLRFTGFSALVSPFSRTETVLIDSTSADSADGNSIVYTDNYKVQMYSGTITEVLPHTGPLTLGSTGVNGSFSLRSRVASVSTSSITTIRTYTTERTILKATAIANLVEAAQNPNRDIAIYGELAKIQAQNKQAEKDRRAVTVYGAMGASVGFMAFAMFA